MEIQEALVRRAVSVTSMAVINRKSRLRPAPATARDSRATRYVVAIEEERAIRQK